MANVWGQPAVVSLSDVRARDAAIVGSKTANLAVASAAGLPVLPGFTLVDQEWAGDIGESGEEAVRRAWRELSDEGRRALVVRSSSVHEDTEQSSMAGRFESVLRVKGWDAFADAVRTVIGSGIRATGGPGPAEHEPSGTSGPAAPAAAASDDPPEDGTAGFPTTISGLPEGMAVLVQPMLEAVAGGVMFGADPVAGRTDRIVVSAVEGGPDRLVDGSTRGVRFELTRWGRLVATEPAKSDGEQVLGRLRLMRLVRLAQQTRKVFDAPQDVEFAFDDQGRLWLFQSRPITAMSPRAPRGARVLGPGPVVETLPGVLQPLEEDLWLVPMSHGLTLALDLTRAVSRGRLRELPVVRTVEGRAAADLRLLGAVPIRHPLLNLLNPAPGARRASAAWRVGRLRQALPLLALDLMADVDRELTDIGPPDQLLSGQILDTVSWGRTVLSSLHAQESLAGALLDTSDGGRPAKGATEAGSSTAIGEALAVLAEGRRKGLGDETLLSRHPVLLALLPPSLGERALLPATNGWSVIPRGVESLPVREGLRLRVRWVQEMQATMIRELAGRLSRDEALCEGDTARIRLLRWSELTRAAADGGGLPRDLPERVPRPETPELPAAFRLVGGRPVPEPIAGHAVSGGGEGAGGGFGTGIAWDGRGERPGQPVLVLRTLDPGFAGLLPGLAGLVAETGSALSHLAVLARESRVPTVVGVPDASSRFPPGTGLFVDGGTGAVEQRADPSGRPVPAPAQDTDDGREPRDGSAA